MRFETDLNTRLLPHLLSDFVAIVGWDAWVKRQQGLQQQLHENPLFRHYFLERHSLELALFDLMAYRRTRGRLPKIANQRAAYQLYSFMAAAVGFHKRLTAPGRNRLAGRIRDGLQSENGLVAVQHELHVAVHFMCHGFDIEPLDLQNDGGVDFVVAKNDVVVEVECKMASADIGRQIHERRMVELSHAVQPVLKGAAPRADGGHMVTVTLPARLTGQRELHRRISEGVAAVLSGSESALSTQEFKIRHETFDLAASPFWDITETESAETLRRFLTHQHGKRDAHALVYGKPRKTAVIVVVESAKPDKMAESIYRQIKSAAENQFSGQRPGVVVVQLSDFTPTQLESLARSQGSTTNALQAIASRLFNHPERAFLHNVAFVSAGGAQSRTEVLGTRVTDVVTDDGPCYVFRNTNNQHCDDPRYRFFDATPSNHLSNMGN